MLDDVKLSGKAVAIRELNIEWSSDVGAVLAEAFGLTQAEVDVASLLYQYTEISKIAAARGVNIHTIRKQIGQLFTKTDTKGQAELVRLLALLSARIASKRKAHVMAWSDPYGREKLLEIDGDTIAYTWIGSETGTPALFIPGLVNGYLFPSGFDKTLKANDVKLYVLSRPGTGNCKCTSAIDPLDQHATVVLKFCAALELRGIVAAGLHCCVTALAVAAVRSPGIFSTIIGLGRFLQLTPERLKRVAPVPRAMVWIANNAPWAAEVIGQQAVRAMHKYGPDWYLNRAYGDMPFDHKFARQPDIAALMRNACAFTYRQGYQIFFNDFVIRKYDIRPFLRISNIRLHWLMGKSSVYGSPDATPGFYTSSEIEEVLANFPLVSFEGVPDAGELLCYQRPVLVAQRIAEAANGLRFGAL